MPDTPTDSAAMREAARQLGAMANQLQAAQNAELDLRTENQHLREHLAHTAGFLLGLAHSLETIFKEHRYGPGADYDPTLDMLDRHATDCRILAENLRIAAGMRETDAADTGPSPNA